LGVKIKKIFGPPRDHNPVLKIPPEGRGKNPPKQNPPPPPPKPTTAEPKGTTPAQDTTYQRTSTTLPTQTQFTSHISFIGLMMRSQHPPHTNNI